MSGKVKFSIRDDDLHAVSPIKEITNLYENVFKYCPVSFSTIPYVSKKVLIDDHWRSVSRESLFIGDNRNIVDTLRSLIQDGKAHITLHGYNHKSVTGIPEFLRSDINPDARIVKGIEALENVFGHPVTVFVPPHNAMSVESHSALQRAELDVLRTFRYRVRQMPFTSAGVRNCVRSLWFSAMHFEDGLSYPQIMSFRTHKEFACYGLYNDTDLERLLSGLNFCIQNNHSFCLAVHYRALLNERKTLDTFQKFWSEVRNNYLDELTFVNASELFNE
jgi:predicted deacetylase